jgi:hypothetical protein
MDIRYIAGLFDGEGSVMLIASHANRRKSPTAQISNNILSLLTPVKHMFGGSIATKKPRKTTHSVSYDWRVTGQSAMDFFACILPHMHHPEKIRKINLILRKYKSVTPRNGKYTETQLQDKIAFENEFFHPSNP